jgi:hypothetical protein
VKRSVLIGIIALALYPTSASSIELTWKSYSNPENDAFRQHNSLWIDGLKSGLIASNANLRHGGMPPMFCLPPNLALTVEQAEDILQRAAKKVRKVPDDMPVSIILLDGLKDTFPCTK